MSDTWGAIGFPAESIDSDEVTTDRALAMIGSFLQAAVNHDLGQLWDSVAPGTRPIDHVFVGDPRHKFNDAKLPALYLFEESSTTTAWTSDIDVDTRVISLQWVSRLSSPKHEILRESARHVIGKSIARACRQGRHVAWVQPGDTESLAATRGSLIQVYAGVQSIKRLVAKPLELSITLRGEEQRAEPFRGWASQIQIVEHLTLGTGSNVDAAISATVTVNGNTTAWQTINDPIA